jgi:hypothetical protein
MKRSREVRLAPMTALAVADALDGRSQIAALDVRSQTQYPTRSRYSRRFGRLDELFIFMSWMPPD